MATNILNTEPSLSFFYKGENVSRIKGLSIKSTDDSFTLQIIGVSGKVLYAGLQLPKNKQKELATLLLDNL